MVPQLHYVLKGWAIMVASLFSRVLLLVFVVADANLKSRTKFLYGVLTTHPFIYCQDYTKWYV